MVEFEIGQVELGFNFGDATYHTYLVSGKSIEARMNVFVDQLIPMILLDNHMSQSKKVMALNYLQRKQVLLSKKANNGANVPYATQIDFKHNVRKQVLKLLFKTPALTNEEYNNV